jgi:hypothetical protein
VPSLQRGDTFYWNEGGHLWVVISESSSGVFVAVNITKDWFRAGKECELLPGEHPWINYKSYISFGDALRIGPAEHANLTKSIEEGDIKMHVAATEQLLQKIIAAGKKSKALAEELIALL